MSSLTAFRTMSIDFRRLTSTLLRSDRDNADTNLRRVKTFIDNTPFIYGTIRSLIDNIEYDYRNCFKTEGPYKHGEIVPPEEEACHIKAMYDYMEEISKSNVIQASLSYGRYSGKYSEIIQEFLERAFKPLFAFIIDSISKEMINMEAKEKVTTMQSQTIGTVQGNVIQQGTGTVTTYTTINNNDVHELRELLTAAISSLEGIKGIPEGEIDSVRDDIDTVNEQIQTLNPKVSRLKKAFNGISKFAGDFILKLGVSLAVSEVAKMDWAKLIEKLGTFISSLHP